MTIKERIVFAVSWAAMYAAITFMMIVLLCAMYECSKQPTPTQEYEEFNQ